MTVLALGKEKLNAQMTFSDRLYMRFSYNEFISNPKLVTEIKDTFAKPKWEKEQKQWSFELGDRTTWALKRLTGKQPYAHYDQKYPLITPNRDNLYHHQLDGTSWMLTCKRVIFAAEMGTGKSLTSVETLEHAPKDHWWWVGPASALTSVKLDFLRWHGVKTPRFMSYEQMLKIVSSEFEVPDGVVFDEMSKLKNWLAKRTQGAAHLAEYVRRKDGYLIGLTGTPAPKSPLDWWSLCEVIQPGYIRENSPAKFRNRLALVKQETAESGQTFPNIETFWDNEKKCGVCGKFKDHDNHVGDVLFGQMTGTDAHAWVPSFNEVSFLSKRLSGLVKVVMKRDCLDLPDKVYKQVVLPPTKYMQNLSKMIAKTSRNVIQALTKQRALSDGFQYTSKIVGRIDCVRCDKKGCEFCSLQGYLNKMEDTAVRVETPKTAALLDLIEERDRIIVFAGFTESIDLVVETIIKAGWKWIRLDGRGWHTSESDKKGGLELVPWFQSESTERIAFIAHPKSGGMGLTLTRSDMSIYYSNDFDGESRTQSEDRNYRIGTTKCTIVDLLHLKTDMKVLTNLKTKRSMELMTLGELEEDAETSD